MMSLEKFTNDLEAQASAKIEQSSGLVEFRRLMADKGQLTGIHSDMGKNAVELLTKSAETIKAADKAHSRRAAVDVLREYQEHKLLPGQVRSAVKDLRGAAREFLRELGEQVPAIERLRSKIETADSEYVKPWSTKVLADAVWAQVEQLLVHDNFGAGFLDDINRLKAEVDKAVATARQLGFQVDVSSGYKAPAERAEPVSSNTRFDPRRPIGG